MKEAIAKWEVIHHEMLAVSNLHRELSGLKTSSYDMTVNHEFSKSKTAAGE